MNQRQRIASSSSRASRSTAPRIERDRHRYAARRIGGNSFVLRDRRDLQPQARAFGDFDREMRAFFRMKLPRKQR